MTKPGLGELTIKPVLVRPDQIVPTTVIVPRDVIDEWTDDPDELGSVTAGVVAMVTCLKYGYRVAGVRSVDDNPHSVRIKVDVTGRE